MTDYIRKAVQLADGWFPSKLSDELVRHKSSIGKADCTSWLWNQATLDALAAQLVRQVDAIGDPIMLVTNSTSVVIHELGVAVGIPYVGPDRTMNTIKAIVDSGVLDKEST